MWLFYKWYSEYYTHLQWIIDRIQRTKYILSAIEYTDTMIEQTNLIQTTYTNKQNETWNQKVLATDFEAS